MEDKRCIRGHCTGHGIFNKYYWKYRGSIHNISEDIYHYYWQITCFVLGEADRGLLL